MDVRIEQARDVPWTDVERSLGAGDGSSCWCQWPVNPDYRTMTRQAKHDALREQVGAARSGPALVAYVDDRPAGWCRIGPRTEQPRLVSLPIVRRSTHEPLDDAAVWAVSCFVVRREFRGYGVSRTLLEHAIAFAFERGARLIEGYPIDLAERPNASSNSLYIGSLSLFESLGFTVSERPAKGRAVVTLGLDHA